MIDQERKDREDIINLLYEESVKEQLKDQYLIYAETVAESMCKVGYQKVSEGDIIIHKDTTKRTEEEIEWLANHNKAVREEAAEKIFWYLNDEWDHNPWHFVDWLKEEFGVEIKDE